MVAYGVDPGFLRACDQTLQIVLRRLPLHHAQFMRIALLYTIGRGFISGSGLAMDWGPIIKATWIFFLLFFYQTLMDTLGTGHRRLHAHVCHRPVRGRSLPRPDHAAGRGRRGPQRLHGHRRKRVGSQRR